MSLFNVEIEGALLATLLQHPEVFSECYLIGESDWSDTNRPIFAVIKQQLSQVPAGSVSPISLAEKLKGYSITTVSGIEVLPYLEGLTIKCIQKSDAGATARELKRYTVRRELIRQVEQTRAELISKPNLSFDEMTKLVESGLSNITTGYYKEETVNLMTNLVEIIEKQGENPLKDDEMGYLSPFPSINATLGAISYSGSLTVVGARTGGSKSSLAWYYNMHVAERYNLVCLHLDTAEMSEMELIQRAVCCLSKGRVPLWAITQQRWRENKEWVKIIRGECWPRVQQMMKTGIHYQNIGGMSNSDVITYIKRFYHSKVGRDNHLLINLDYIKGSEVMNSRGVEEYKAVGNFVNDLKTLISSDITGSIFTSIQNNRSGITTGKKIDELVDSESAFSLSDRVIHQASHGFVMRYKIPAESAKEQGLYGNIKLSCVKKRRVVGRRGEEIMRPIKLSSGAFIDNYFNLNTHGFFFEDRGLASEMLSTLGQLHSPMVRSTPPVSGL